MKFLITCLALCLVVNEVAEARRCSDQHQNCYWWSILNFCVHPRHSAAMATICKESCHLCDSPGPAIPVRRRNRPPLTATTCRDRDANCAAYKAQGYCSYYEQWMGQNCQLTCAKCPQITDTDCKDLNANCPSWSRFCTQTSIYWPYMSKNCKKTCKICPDGGSGGGGGGGSAKKEYVCDFEGDFCEWSNQPIDDAANWALGVASGGPSSGAKGSASYAYVDSISNTYNAKLILPWELVLPLNETTIGLMCLHISYQTGTGSLKIIENVYPTASNRSPQTIVKATLQGSGTWVDGKVLVQVDDKRQLTLEGIVGSSGRIAIDKIAFIKGRC